MNKLSQMSLKFLDMCNFFFKIEIIIEFALKYRKNRSKFPKIYNL